MVERFGLIGASGYVAPRHLQAIRDTGNSLVAAVDPHDSVGILDRYFPETRFFTEIERFDRFLEKLRRESERGRVRFISICSPNYLHDAHVRLTLRLRAHAICEKPLVINPWNLDPLLELEAETGCRVHPVQQLRLHPSLLALKRRLDEDPPQRRADVCLTYVTPRGPWYDVSWKGSQQKSGGLAMNIGVHFFDVLLWLFGPVETSTVHLAEPKRMAGGLEVARARVRWFLSVEARDLPEGCLRQPPRPYRAMTVDGEPVDLSGGFDELHTRVYEDILAGRGLAIEDARPSIELVHAIRNCQVTTGDRERHPFLVA